MADSAARSGCGISPSTVPSALTMPAMFSSEPLGFAACVDLPLGGRVAEHDLVAAARSARSVSGSAWYLPSPCEIGIVSTWPGRSARVNGVSTLSTTTCVDWQRYCRHSLRMSAPGSSPASHRIWKPLHEPSTSPPRGDEVGQRLHHGRAAGHGARAQVVAVGEAAGQDHAVEVARSRSRCQTYLTGCRRTSEMT